MLNGYKTLQAVSRACQLCLWLKNGTYVEPVGRDTNTSPCADSPPCPATDPHGVCPPAFPAQLVCYSTFVGMVSWALVSQSWVHERDTRKFWEGWPSQPDT